MTSNFTYAFLHIWGTIYCCRLQSVKCPRKKLWPVETQGFWWNCCQVGQISCPENCRKNEKFRKNKNTPANYIIWANYCNTEWTNIFRTKKMPPNCILWGKFQKSVVFSKKVVITFSHFVSRTFFLLSICSPMDRQQGVITPWNGSDQCVTSYGTLNLKNTSLTPIFDHFQIIISHRKNVVEQRSSARCSRRLTYFPHAATCNTSCVDEVGLFGQKPSKNGK